jgi:hypothetical protein
VGLGLTFGSNTGWDCKVAKCAVVEKFRKIASGKFICDGIIGDLRPNCFSDRTKISRGSIKSSTFERLVVGR